MLLAWKVSAVVSEDGVKETLGIDRPIVVAAIVAVVVVVTDAVEGCNSFSGIHVSRRSNS